jgi:hypothetical protein
MLRDDAAPRLFGLRASKGNRLRIGMVAPV